MKIGDCDVVYVETVARRYHRCGFVPKHLARVGRSLCGLRDTRPLAIAFPVWRYQFCIKCRRIARKQGIPIDDVPWSDARPEPGACKGW